MKQKEEAWTLVDDKEGTVTVFKRRPFLTWLRNLFAAIPLFAFLFVANAHAVATYVESSVKGIHADGFGQESSAFVAVPQFPVTNVNYETQAYLLVNLATNTVSAEIQSMLPDVPYGRGNNADFTTYRIYYNPVVSSSGTAITITPNKLGTSASSQLQIFTGPSAVSTGTLIGVFTIGSTASTSQVPLGYPYGLDISTGTKILFTALATQVSTATLNISWTERGP